MLTTFHVLEGRSTEKIQIEDISVIASLKKKDFSKKLHKNVWPRYIVWSGSFFSI
jgi:hypothetical protein